MPLTLIADEKTTKDPGAADIASAFESLDRKSGGLLSGPGLSMIILQRDEAHLLMATGTHAAGFMLSLNDGERESQYNTSPDQPVSVDETARIFQAYARNEDWGRSNFQWEHCVVEEKTSTVAKRLFIMVVVGILAYIILRSITR